MATRTADYLKSTKEQASRALRQKSRGRSFGWTLAGIAAIGLLAAAAYWLYPEARRTMQMHSM